MADYRKASSRGKPVPGVYIRHQQGCPAEHHDGPRCRCEPSYRARRRDLGWSPTFKTLDAASEWKASGTRSAPIVKAQSTDGPTFGALARLWWDGVADGSIAKRKGSDQYSDTTLKGYKSSLFTFLAPRTFADPDANPLPLPSVFENEPAANIEAQAWQTWVDRLSREGTSRSRINNHLAVIRAIYGWASRPSRRLVPMDPTRGIEMPPNREVPRLRVAPADEAQRLLDALGDDDALPYGIAFYTGARLSEIDRLDWADVFMDAHELIVWKSKTRAGTNRRVPIAAPLIPMLKRAWLKQGRPTQGRLLGDLNITSCGLLKRARKAWGWEPVLLKDGSMGWGRAREDAFEWITMHNCRHTYASFLMAAGYNLRELMEFMGHSSLQATERYVKMLPQARGEKRADRLNTYLEGAM